MQGEAHGGSERDGAGLTLVEALEEALMRRVRQEEGQCRILKFFALHCSILAHLHLFHPTRPSPMTPLTSGGLHSSTHHLCTASCRCTQDPTPGSASIHTQMQCRSCLILAMEAGSSPVLSEAFASFRPPKFFCISCTPHSTISHTSRTQHPK